MTDVVDTGVSDSPPDLDTESSSADGQSDESRDEAGGATRSVHERYPFDIERVLVLRLAGVRVRDNEPYWHWRAPTPLLILSILPILMSFTIETIWPSGSPLISSYYGWHLFFIFINFLAVLFPWAGCRLFYGLTEDLDAMLTDDGRAMYHQWADWTTRRTPQVLAMTTTAIGGVAALHIAQAVPGISARLYVTPTSYLATFLTSFLVANSIYWIIAGTVLGYLLTRAGRLNLMWAAPARTPGIESLAKCYRQSFYMSSIGTAVCMIPLLFWAYQLPASVELSAVKIALLVLSLTSTVAIAILPQWWLSSVVSHFRHESLRALQQELSKSITDVADWSDKNISQLTSLIKAVGDSPSTTVNDRTVVALLLGATTAVLPYLIRFAL